MWYIILGYLLVSALFALLFWLLLIAAKRKGEGAALDLPEEQAEGIRSSDGSDARDIFISPNRQAVDNPVSVTDGTAMGKGNRSDQNSD